MRIKTPLTEEELKKLYSFFKRYFDSSRIRIFPVEEEYKEFFTFLVEDEEINSLFVEDEDDEDGFIHLMMKIGVEEYLKSLSKKIRRVR